MAVTQLHPEVREPEIITDGPIEGVLFKPLEAYNDHRGWLIELYRDDEISEQNRPAMCYVSQTQPGVARGPHEHVEQSDYFAFIGPGQFTLYLWDTRVFSSTWGNKMKVVLGEANKQSVIIPPGVVHAYKNTGDRPGWVFNVPNRLYAGEGKREPVDEIRHEDRPDSPYYLN